jgi:hypothetical protein
MQLSQIPAFERQHSAMKWVLQQLGQKNTTMKRRLEELEAMSFQVSIGVTRRGRRQEGRRRDEDKEEWERKEEGRGGRMKEEQKFIFSVEALRRGTKGAKKEESDGGQTTCDAKN